MIYRSSILLLLFLWVFPANAAPLYRAVAGPATITLYSDECRTPGITNLPRRAIWHEGGKDVEGCFGVSPFGVAVFYFADKTATAIPIQAFEKVSET